MSDVLKTLCQTIDIWHTNVSLKLLGDLHDSLRRVEKKNESFIKGHFLILANIRIMQIYSLSVTVDYAWASKVLETSAK